MKTVSVVAVAVLMVLLAGCIEPTTAPDMQSLATATSGEQGLSKGNVLNYVAPLSGSEEVPPVDTKAAGNTILQLNKEGNELRYKLIVANIENVTQAHIHCGPEGANGPVVAFLYGFTPGGVTVNGILAEGIITNADVIPRPDSGVCPGGVSNFDELLAQISSGNAYVNVHTIQYPGGEIRGQISRGNGMSR
jgi:hypothetical protein